MTEDRRSDPAALRAARADNPKSRDRDLALGLGVSEAELLAAHVGHGATRIAAHPDRIVPELAAFGSLMALTRNESCVIEKTGVYDNYSGGGHAGFIANGEIDLRFFPAHWVTAFALERETSGGQRRSIQVFDAAGDAVHKIYLTPDSDVTLWEPLVGRLREAEQRETLAVAPRPPMNACRAAGSCTRWSPTM